MAVARPAALFIIAGGPRDGLPYDSGGLSKPIGVSITFLFALHADRGSPGREGRAGWLCGVALRICEVPRSKKLVRTQLVASPLCGERMAETPVVLPTANQ
ncbi:hypothetical protein NDU88_003437 [Pleurodeles waltl]|uniref:Uncharacterized protein n=1 Tax=Pleurodeles waltl TaxID=8319 RepID=A0AAV7MS79_PLEWA|nr:hypothetical protein NDU88_003437 [Pleurodeles waltl]